ncbi:uncharacterized protein TRIREDRAFT_107843 [Trichoderma reesei QM6a]|uniref:Predicted protein n=2 Tax=Hypocrea jecorina TaxID=51453 RepID=G0RKI2_HYPJQ|nr:uncharacterized protein TRIREDRAFT_107843 [Trichoderma reesei QM6a]EGR48431.1 predicted protein [Trichoderma reesei QM6a]ETS07078.1 hypothetical protein M419DRAFT_126507 [Trichoderma reesei RUT C-30]
MSAVSSFSDSREFLGVHRDAHSFRSSYHRLARKCRRNPSPSIPTTTALVSAALTSAAPVVKFEARRPRVLFVPDIPKPSHSTITLSHYASVSQTSLSAAVGGQDAPPQTPSPEPAALRPRPRISIRTTTIDDGTPYQSPSSRETLRNNSSKESLASPTPSPATTISLTSPRLEVPISPHSPRRNRFSRGHSPACPLRNASQDSHLSQSSLRTTGSPVSNKFEDLLQAIGSMVDDHVRQLRGSLLSPVGKSSKLPRDHCRETLVSLQQEIHSLLQRPPTDPTNTLRYRALFELYHELRETLVSFQRDLAAERISDNYCADFCQNIVDYGKRLNSFVVKTW